MVHCAAQIGGRVVFVVLGRGLVGSQAATDGLEYQSGLGICVRSCEVHDRTRVVFIQVCITEE